MKTHLAELTKPQSDRTYTVPEADAYCATLARSHYENFTVGSALLPRRLRRDFFAVYAFCRWADDLGDELGDPQKSLKMLTWWRSELDACYAGKPRHPVFVSLQETVDRFAIPRKPFDDLIDAFMQDQTVTRYETYPQVLDYCTRSANPVGRLVLYLCGYSDEERQSLSDCTCTALQLTNFWQDVARDLTIPRVYLPLADMEEFGYSYEELFALKFSPAFREVMRLEVDRAQELFEQGLPLIGMIRGPLRLDINLFSRGGMAILKKIIAQDYNVLTHRPGLTRGEKIRLTGSWLFRRLIHRS